MVSKGGKAREVLGGDISVRLHLTRREGLGQSLESTVQSGGGLRSMCGGGNLRAPFWICLCPMALPSWSMQKVSNIPGRKKIKPSVCLSTKDCN